MPFLEPVTLKGRHAILVPLSQEHHDDLVEAVKDGALWNLWYTFIPKPESMKAEIARRLALQEKGTMLPFAILDTGGKAVGMTTFMDADAANRRVEIGSTWYRMAVQRTAMNTECKLMLLTHAFERMGCIAVEFRTHFLNRQSRNGIERLGAKLDGILRSHRIMPDGTLRDTVVYSIVASEWPTVKIHLSWQLAKPRSGTAGR
ncbi:MAG: GNAT family N-acetyltransferase [Alphaproteobacteria bacterium]|nr:GNAT family N-acetyltransferase [Alphaproteobacteria bacterium]MBN9571476.1 GNAT family N-acetyltransferase [Alphaproteobacteria bacterium]